MGIQTIITSDYNGRRINDPDIKPTKITLTQHGQTAKDAFSVELYLSPEDLEDFMDRLSDPAKTIIPPSMPSPQDKATKKSSTKPASEDAEYKEALLKELDLTDPAARKREQNWLAGRDWGSSDVKQELAKILKETGRDDADRLERVLYSRGPYTHAAVLKIARMQLGEDAPE